MKTSHLLMEIIYFIMVGQIIRKVLLKTKSMNGLHLDKAVEGDGIISALHSVGLCGEKME